MQAIPDSLNIVLGQQRIADCLKEVHHIGSTTFMDVCTGASYSVPWGTGDWLSNVALAAVVGGLIIFVVGLGLIVAIDTIRNG